MGENATIEPPIVPIPTTPANRDKSGRFGKGNIANPTGRPKLQIDRRAIFLECLTADKIRKLVRKMGKLAMKGDRFAIAYLLDQGLGKALQSMQVQSTVEVITPEARRMELLARLGELGLSGQKPAAIDYEPRPDKPSEDASAGPSLPASVE